MPERRVAFAAELSTLWAIEHPGLYIHESYERQAGEGIRDGEEFTLF